MEFSKAIIVSIKKDFASLTSQLQCLDHFDQQIKLHKTDVDEIRNMLSIEQFALRGIINSIDEQQGTNKIYADNLQERISYRLNRIQECIKLLHKEVTHNNANAYFIVLLKIVYKIKNVIDSNNVSASAETFLDKNKISIIQDISLQTSSSVSKAESVLIEDKNLALKLLQEISLNVFALKGLLKAAEIELRKNKFFVSNKTKEGIYMRISNIRQCLHKLNNNLAIALQEHVQCPIQDLISEITNKYNKLVFALLDNNPINKYAFFSNKNQVIQELRGFIIQLIAKTKKKHKKNRFKLELEKTYTTKENSEIEKILQNTLAISFSFQKDIHNEKYLTVNGKYALSLLNRPVKPQHDFSTIRMFLIHNGYCEQYNKSQNIVHANIYPIVSHKAINRFIYRC